MAVAQNTDGNSKQKVDRGLEPSCGAAGPCERIQLRKMGGGSCSDKGPSIGNQDMNRGMFKQYKLNKKQKKDNQDSLSEIDDSEVVGYLNTKEEINYKRILWEAINGKYIEAKKRKRTTDTKKGVSVKKAAKTTEKVELQKPSSRINYEALKFLDDELNNGSGTAQIVGADSSYAHRTEGSPYGNISGHGSDESRYSDEVQHEISYGKDYETFGHSDGDYEYENEHLNDEYFDF